MLYAQDVLKNQNKSLWDRRWDLKLGQKRLLTCSGSFVRKYFKWLYVV